MERPEVAGSVPARARQARRVALHEAQGPGDRCAHLPSMSACTVRRR